VPKWVTQTTSLRIKRLPQGPLGKNLSSYFGPGVSEVVIDTRQFDHFGGAASVRPPHRRPPAEASIAEPPQTLRTTAPRSGEETAESFLRGPPWAPSSAKSIATNDRNDFGANTGPISEYPIASSPLRIICSTRRSVGIDGKKAGQFE
jgi:hypothetical protein